MKKIHIYETKWENETRKLHYPKTEVEKIEKFIYSLSDISMKVALISYFEAQRNVNLEDIIIEAMDFSGIMMGPRNKKKDETERLLQFADRNTLPPPLFDEAIPMEIYKINRYNNRNFHRPYNKHNNKYRNTNTTNNNNNSNTVKKPPGYSQMNPNF